MVLSVGPGFIAQVEMGVRCGARACASIVAGLYTCSAVVITASYLGIVRFLDNPRVRFGLSLFNGLIILAWGAIKVINSHLPQAVDGPFGRRKFSTAPAACYLKGFLLTATNPIALLFWVNIITLAHINLGIRREALPLFMVGLVGTAVTLDFCKCGLIARSKKFIKPRALTLITRALGVVLVIMGAYLIVRVF